MAEEMMLMADVPGLGAQGQIVRVHEGYARNYLVPRKLASPVTAGVRRQVEKRMQERAEEEAKGMESAKAVAATLEAEAFSCTIPMKVGPEGKLYGSVTSADVATVLKKDHGIKLAKSQIRIDEPIRELGVFKVAIELPHQILATLKVWVVEE